MNWSRIFWSIGIPIIDLHFPKNIEQIPNGTESTDKLPKISLWPSFAAATKLMQPQFEEVLKNLPHLSFMITDGFLYWTVESANKFSVPRFVYYGMSSFAQTVSRILVQSEILREIESDDELFSIPGFPRVKLTRNDFEPIFTDRKPKGPHFEFIKKPWWVRWLDEKEEQGKGVLYVAFGSQAEISAEQFTEIKSGLEESEVNFLWVVRKNVSELGDGFEERVKERGIVVKEWVNQREILGHESIKGFLSHCGWNSVIESICAKVPVLAWPMMAEQPLNARMVAEEIKIGIRVEIGKNGFVKAEDLEKNIRELMEGEKGKEMRKKVKEVGEAAIRAVEEGGSSWKTLNELLLNDFRRHPCKKKTTTDGEIV